MNNNPNGSAVLCAAELKNYFKRYEIKFLITPEGERAVREAMERHSMSPDRWGRSRICNLYYDTPDLLLARNSSGGPIYKEKLRVRSYGEAERGGRVFVELKKKHKGIVYKRRIPMCEGDAMSYLAGGDAEVEPSLLQIKREIDWFLSFYRELSPAVFLSYDREAFFSDEDPELRITFDRNIAWRTDRLSLLREEQKDAVCQSVLPPDVVLMEIKTATAIPLWLTSVLTKNAIFRTPFSKYGNACRAHLASLQSAPKPLTRDGQMLLPALPR